LTEAVDGLFKDIITLSSGPQETEKVRQDHISSQKVKILDAIARMDTDDALLYAKMFEKFDAVMRTKDSIRIAQRELDNVRKDLNRCIRNYQTAKRDKIFSSPSTSNNVQ
jgi:hypothetical protein